MEGAVAKAFADKQWRQRLVIVLLPPCTVSVGGSALLENSDAHAHTHHITPDPQMLWLAAAATVCSGVLLYWNVRTWSQRIEEEEGHNEGDGGRDEDKGGHDAAQQHVRPTGASTCGAFAAGERRQVCRAIKACRRGHEAVQVLSEHGACSDAACVTAALEACGRSKDWQLISKLLAGPGLEPTQACFAAAISAFGRSDRCAEALELLDAMKALGEQPGPACLIAAIGCCASAGQCERAHELLHEIRAGGFPLTEIAFVAAMSACGKAAQGEKALALLDVMRASDLQPGPRAYNTVIAACCKSGLWSRATSLLREMHTRGVAPNRLVDALKLGDMCLFVETSPCN